MIGPSWRKFFGSLTGVAHSVGFIGISVIAMYLPDRQLLTIACSEELATLTYIAFA